MPKSTMPRARIENLKARLWSERSSFDAHWREIGDYLVPRRTRFWTGDRNRGDKRNQNIIDSTGRFAARTLQSGLHAGLTSPARPWMRLTTPDPTLAERDAVREWLHAVTQRMLTVFAQSNLYQGLPILYGDLGVFGTAAMAVLEDSQDLFRVQVYPIGSYALGLDHRGLVSTFIREYELTVAQVVQEFGGWEGRPLRLGHPIDWRGISSTVQSLWNQGQYEAAVPCVWVVMPNPNARENAFDSRFLPFLSLHYEAGSRGLGREYLRESGFRSFPVLIPRWDITGDDSYGTDCPGMTALGDVKQLQIMQRKKAQAISKQVDPPLVGPSALRTQRTSLLAGDITYVDVREGMTGLRPIHEVQLNIEHLVHDIAETQYRIQRAFYEDLFLMLATSDRIRGTEPPTAREIEERHEEKLLALGPVLERTNDELLKPLIDRAYELMDRAGLIPKAPPELEGVDLRAEFISILAQAQKSVGVLAQDRLVQTAMPMMEAFPELRHKVDSFRLLDNYAEMLGVDPRVIRSDEEAQARVEQQETLERRMLEAEEAQKQAAAAHALGTTPMDQDSALKRIVQGIGAAA